MYVYFDKYNTLNSINNVNNIINNVLVILEKKELPWEPRERDFVYYKKPRWLYMGALLLTLQPTKTYRKKII